jgi:putative nucleotidyltransferase with HDIG domain
MVGNMAERAAEAIGANTLIVRTGAYYHDIGKLKRPYFFVENQQGRNNPHDNIKPDLSTRIITSHLTDGMELVKKANLPLVIQDIVAQHHGTSAVMYFYHKTKTESENTEDVNIDDFRYKGVKPVSKEAAIIMLADSVEAAVRSMDNPSAKSVKEMIEKIFKSRLDDGQLDNCDLTLREMRTVLESFMTALTGLYHERVEYPNEKDDN